MDKNSKNTNVTSIIERLSLEFKNGKLVTDTTIDLTAQLVPAMQGTNILADAVETLRRLASHVTNIERSVALQLSWSCKLGVKGYFCALATAILVVDLVSSPDSSNPTSSTSTNDMFVEQVNSSHNEDNAQASSMNDITEQLNNSLRELTKHTENLEALGSLVSKMENLCVHIPPYSALTTAQSQQKDYFTPIELITAPGVYKCRYGILTWDETGSSFVGSGWQAKILAAWFNSVNNASVKCILLNARLDTLLMIAEFHKSDFLTFTHAKTSKEKKIAFDILFPLFTRCTFQWCIQNLQEELSYI